LLARASTDSVQTYSGCENAFGSGLVHQCNGNDRRHLLQQTQRIDPVPVILALDPWKLDRQAELIAYSIDIILYPFGR